MEQAYRESGAEVKAQPCYLARPGRSHPTTGVSVGLLVGDVPFFRAIGRTGGRDKESSCEDASLVRLSYVDILYRFNVGELHASQDSMPASSPRVGSRFLLVVLATAAPTPNRRRPAGCTTNITTDSGGRPLLMAIKYQVTARNLLMEFVRYRAWRNWASLKACLRFSTTATAR